MPVELGTIVLRTIWLSAVIFALVGLVLMLALCIRRLIEERRQALRGPIIVEARKQLMQRASGGTGSGAANEAVGTLRPEEALALLSDLSQMIRGDGEHLLHEVAEELGLERWLLKKLSSRRARQRIDAARQLSLFDGPRARSALVDALGDPILSVRLAAAEALVRQDAHLDTVIRHLLLEPASANGPAMRVLGLMADQSPQTLYDRIGVEISAALRRKLFAMLADRGYLPIATDLERELGAEDAKDRHAALNGLARLRHPRLLVHARAALADRSPLVREQAAQILGDRKNDTALSPLWAGTA